MGDDTDSSTLLSVLFPCYLAPPVPLSGCGAPGQPPLPGESTAWHFLFRLWVGPALLSGWMLAFGWGWYLLSFQPPSQPQAVCGRGCLAGVWAALLAGGIPWLSPSLPPHAHVALVQ